MVLQTALLRENFASARRRGDHLYRIFYDTLFQRYPAFSLVFDDVDLDEQGPLLIEAVQTVLDNLDDADGLVEALQDFGRMHPSVAKLAMHNTPVGECFVDALSIACCPVWDDRLAFAWKRAYEYASNLMLSDRLALAAAY